MQLVAGAGTVPQMPAPLAPQAPGWFAQVTPGSGTPTVIAVDWLNMVQAELKNVVESVGLTLNTSEFSQVRDAILALGSFADTGAANAYAISTAVPAQGIPAIEAPVNGSGFLILAKTTNTGPSLLTVDGNPAASWLNNAGGALSPGDIVDGTVYPVRFDGANYRMTGVTNEQIQIQIGDAIAGNIQATTEPPGTNNNTLATTGFVFEANNAVAPVNVAGNANVTLLQQLWGLSILKLTGALTGNIDLIFPAGLTGKWAVWNAATGNFTITATTGSGTTTVIPQGPPLFVVSDGTNVSAVNALGVNRRIPVQTAAFNAVVNGYYPVDTTAGGFPCTLPANPNYGDAIGFSDTGGAWHANNFTFIGNGSLINGSLQNWTNDISNASFTLVFRGGTYGWKFE